MLAAGMAVYLAIYLTWTLRAQHMFATSGDLSIHDQAAWLLSRGHSPFVTLIGANYFGDHLYWIMVAVAPFYWLFPSADTLLVLQSLALALAAIPAFMVARHKLRNEWLACGVAWVYLLNPYIQWINRNGFHPDVFAVPLVFLTFWFAIRSRWRAFFAVIVLLMLVKEDVALLIVGMGIWVAFLLNRRVGIRTTALGALWLFVNFRFLIPLLSGTGSLAAYMSAHINRIPFGGLTGFLHTLVTKPWRVVSYAFSDGRPLYYVQVFTPLAFVPWLSPSTLAAVILPLLANGLSTWAPQHSLQAQYGTLVVSGLVAAAIFGLARAPSRARWAIVGVMLVTALAGLWLWGPVPGSRHPATWPTRSEAYLEAANEAVSLVPSGAVVSAHYRFVPHLDHRTEIYEYPNPWVLTNWGDRLTEGQSLPDRAARVEYVVFSREDNDQGLSGEVFDKLVASGEFKVVFDREGILVAHRVAAP
jgi:uncharacterized membrane protein